MRMKVAELVLEYLKVGLSPQVIAGTGVLVFLWLFKDDIRGLLRRVAKIRFPGGSELSTSQLDRESEEIEPRGEWPPAAPPEPQSLPENLSLTPEQVEAVAEAFKAERARATLWEYRYLNFYLAPTTQRVLDWLASLSSRTTFGLFDSFWMPIIPDAQERRAIISALQAHHLIAIQGELIEVTPKGREYLQWRGPLPSSVEQ